MIEMHELINEYYMYALMKSVEGEEAFKLSCKSWFH